MNYFVIILFFFCNCVAAQDANNSVKRNSIEANFSMKAIEAYEENSFSKVKDFYQFLEIYSDKDSSESLKNQIKENLNSLFLENSLVTDLFTSEKITLEKLLDNIKGKNFKFEAKNIQKERTYANFWTNSYVLEIRNETEFQRKNIIQRIYFYPKEKFFGTKKKEVWSIFLGETE